MNIKNRLKELEAMSAVNVTPYIRIIVPLNRTKEQALAEWMSVHNVSKKQENIVYRVIVDDKK